MPDDLQSTAVPRATESAPHHRVLVVDDSIDAADMLSTWLRLHGYEVAVAHQGTEALALMPAFSPAVALLDLGMPDMSGYELAERVRATPDLRQVTLVAISGWGGEEYETRSRAAGFHHHLTKPVNLTALNQLLAELLPRS